jgi:hypothetical protein
LTDQASLSYSWHRFRVKEILVVIDFEHRYIPIELAQRMGINTETKTIVGCMAGYKERIARSAYRFKLPKSFADYSDRLYFDMAGFEGKA